MFRAFTVTGDAVDNMRGIERNTRSELPAGREKDDKIRKTTKKKILTRAPRERKGKSWKTTMP